MNRVRLGQTEQGSFIVTLLAPVPPALDIGCQAELWPLEDEEPFDRKVTRTLAKSLAASKNAAEATVRGQGLQAFQAAIKQGVNANLCDALATLISRSGGIDVSVTWAKTRPTPEPRSVVRFTPSEGEILREAAREYRSMEPRPDERLDAFVVSLDRKPEAVEGRITLRTFLDGSAVSVRATLSPELYRRAVQAHDLRRGVELTGDLRRSGQRWILENARNLEVAPEESHDGD